MNDVRSEAVICNCCEKPTVEPIYHAEEGDAYCGECVASLLGAERDQYREALLYYATPGPLGGRARAALDMTDKTFCPLCGQPAVIVGREKDRGTTLIHCDDCMTPLS